MAEYAAQIGRNKSTVSRQHARVMSLLGKRMRRALSGLPLPKLLNPPDS